MKLDSKKYRDRLGEYIIEGRNLIDEAKHESCEMKNIIISDEFCSDSEKENLFSHLKDEFSGRIPEDGIVFMRGSLFRRIARTETSQGILAVVKKNEISEDEFTEKLKETDENIVLLDRLQDPGNIGTIIRTSDAAGFAGIIAIKGTGDVFSPKVVRAAAGSIFRVPVFYAPSEEDALRIVKNTSRKLVTTCFDTHISYTDVDMSRRTCIIIGNEGNGVSVSLSACADERVKIPMRQPVDSLNAAVAAGILIYHSIEQKG